MRPEYEKGQILAHVRGHLARVTGRRYQDLDVALEAMSLEALRDLQRLLRDLEAEQRMAVHRARLTPWR